MDHIGALVWGFGFFWEAVGDWQLAEFKKTKKAGPDAVLNTGLWKYTRHPNYFGESVMWWGLWLISTNVGLFTSILVAPAPALMTFLLMNVSGVPLLEKKLNERPKYKEYVETTSQFVPWFPKARATTSSSKSK
jgi:steroid 5-alpha reductase family enzyme